MLSLLRTGYCAEDTLHEDIFSDYYDCGFFKNKFKS